MRALGRRLVRWKAVVILLVVLGIIFYVVMAQSRQRLDALSTRKEQLRSSMRRWIRKIGTCAKN